MPFEREAIADSASAIPTQAPTQMREERSIDPYKVRAMPKIGQPDTTEERVVEKPTEETVKLSPQVAALARKEQRFRQQEQDLKARAEALEKEKAEIADFKAMKAKLGSKDYSALDGLVDYNEYSQYQVDKLNGADPVKDEIKKLNNKIESLEKSTQDNVTKQFEAAVSERRLAVTELVDKSPEFARIKKAKAHEAVVQHILDTWEHDKDKDGNPVELSVAQAAKEVEEILLEKAKQWASLLEEEKAATDEGEKKQLPPLKQGLKTLTNAVQAGDIKRPSKSLQHMSDSERWAEARRRAEEKLQKGER